MYDNMRESMRERESTCVLFSSDETRRDFYVDEDFFLVPSPYLILFFLL